MLEYVDNVRLHTTPTDNILATTMLEYYVVDVLLLRTTTIDIALATTMLEYADAAQRWSVMFDDARVLVKRCSTIFENCFDDDDRLRTNIF